MPALSHIDLQVFLQGRGFDLCDALTKFDYQAEIEAAQEDWIRATGWPPYLIGTSETKTFDQVFGDPVWLPVGIQTLTAISVNGVEYSVDGIQLVRRRPDHPNSGIRFSRAIIRPISISLTGTFGFIADYSASDKLAIFSKAAYELYPKLTGQEGDIVSERQGLVEYKYAESAGLFNGQRGAYLKTFFDAARRRFIGM
jgi:hypothetical protein